MTPPNEDDGTENSTTPCDAGQGPAAPGPRRAFEEANSQTVAEPAGSTATDAAATDASGEPGTTVAMTGEPQPTVTGRRIGHFLLVERLGEGSQGVVWKAIQFEPIKGVVALKVFNLELGFDRQCVDQYRKEAERGRKVSSPSVLPVYELGEADGHIFIAMQYVDGFTLAELIDQRKRWLSGDPPAKLHPYAVLPAKEYLSAVVNVVHQMARTLDEVHKARVIHRDVKPSNILLDRDKDRVFLSDFGLARDLGEVTLRSATFEPGTLVYMPREKLLGERGYDEVRCDVYALGVTLYVASTLCRPFEVPKDLNWSGQCQFIASTEPPPPRAVAPGLPRDLEAITLKAIDCNPRLRYATAGALADDLALFMAGEPVKARPPGPVRRLTRRLLRHRVVLAVAGSLALVAALLLIGQRIRAAIAAERLERICDLARSLIDQGRLEEAFPLVIEAQSRAPADRKTAGLVRDATRAVFNELRDATDTDNVERALRWYRRWLEIEPNNSAERKRFADTFGVQELPVASEPAGAIVSFHGLRPNGQPKSGPALYQIKAGSRESPALLPDVVAGTYWITATDPATGAFVERTQEFRSVREKEASGRAALKLFPHAQAQATAGMRLIPGGALLMGGDEKPGSPEYPRHAVDVAPFFLDANEVTNRDVVRFIERFLDEPARDRWRSWLWPGTRAPDTEKLDFPAVRFTHAMAVEYAASRGCRLPTEEELEWAARGEAGRLAPEGLNPDSIAKEPPWLRLHAVSAQPPDRVETPDGPLFDLFGNAGELTLFRYRPYPGNPPEANRAHWIGNVVRSGLIFSPRARGPVLLGFVQRASQLPSMADDYVGFRCARSLRPRLTAFVPPPVSPN
jgi:serine/threonine-protein kinase